MPHGGVDTAPPAVVAAENYGLICWQERIDKCHCFNEAALVARLGGITLGIHCGARVALPVHTNPPAAGCLTVDGRRVRLAGFGVELGYWSMWGRSRRCLYRLSQNEVAVLVVLPGSLAVRNM